MANTMLCEGSQAQQTLEVLDDLRTLQDINRQEGIADSGFLAFLAEAPFGGGSAPVDRPEASAGEQKPSSAPAASESAGSAQLAEGLRMVDLERALQQMLDAVVHQLTTLLPTPLQPAHEASKLADLHRFLDKLQDIRSKIQNLKAQPKQASRHQSAAEAIAQQQFQAARMSDAYPPVQLSSEHSMSHAASGSPRVDRLCGRAPDYWHSHWLPFILVQLQASRWPSSKSKSSNAPASRYDATMPACMGLQLPRLHPAQPHKRHDSDLEELLSIHQHVPRSPAPALHHESSTQDPAHYRHQGSLHCPRTCASSSNTRATGLDTSLATARRPYIASHHPHASRNQGNPASYPAGPDQQRTRDISSTASLLPPPTHHIELSSSQHIHNRQLLADTLELGPLSNFSNTLCGILGSDPAQDQLPDSLQSAAKDGSIMTQTQPFPGPLHGQSNHPRQDDFQQLHGRTLGPTPGLSSAACSIPRQAALHDGYAGSNTPCTPGNSLIPQSLASAAVLNTPQSIKFPSRPMCSQPSGPHGSRQGASAQQTSSGTVDTDFWPNLEGPNSQQGSDLPEEQIGKIVSRDRAKFRSRQMASGSYPGAHKGAFATTPGAIMPPINLNVNDCNSARITHMQGLVLHPSWQHVYPLPIASVYHALLSNKDDLRLPLHTWQRSLSLSQLLAPSTSVTELLCLLDGPFSCMHKQAKACLDPSSPASHQFAAAAAEAMLICVALGVKSPQGLLGAFNRHLTEATSCQAESNWRQVQDQLRFTRQQKKQLAWLWRTYNDKMQSLMPRRQQLMDSVNAADAITAGLPIHRPGQAANSTMLDPAEALVNHLKLMQEIYVHALRLFAFGICTPWQLGHVLISNYPYGSDGLSFVRHLVTSGHCTI
ncbi:hypothetical protein WJX74_004919 [Apatococcus lobatus]|uniref:Uncharacterized protein n=1 Tax=Apatococcus lobatus TaxID=904363 RepID=A0AAW1QBS2_9CHLO